MANWQGWVAAIGGLITLVGSWISATEVIPLYATIWSIIAIVFGIWAAYTN